MSDLPSRNRDANENTDEVLVEIYYNGDITTSALLTAAGGFNATFAPDVTSIMIVPVDSTDDLRITRTGAASGTTAHLPKTGIAIPITNTVAETMQIFAGSSSAATLFVYGPRT